MFGMPQQNPNEPTFVNRQLLSFAGKVGIIQGRPTYRIDINHKDAAGHTSVYVIIALHSNHVNFFLKMNAYNREKDVFQHTTLEMFALSYKDNWGEQIQHKVNYHFGV